MGFTDKVLNVGTLFSITIVIISLYLKDPADELRVRLENVINGLIEAEGRHTKIPLKVAVGYGACVDLYVDSLSFLPYQKYADTPRPHPEIRSIEDLYQSFAYYFKHGAASERYVSNSTLFDELIDRASRLPNPRYLVSGNAPVIATRFYLEGCDVLLASALTPLRRKAIPDGIKVVGSQTDRDDYHLVMEYKTDEAWGPFVAPRSNRYILHNDYNNPHLTSFDEFDKQLEHFNPDLLIVSGLQLMDNFPFKEGVRENKLKNIKSQMKSMRKNVKVHFEMASIVEEEFLWELQDLIIPYADSLGMNEQELANLYSLYVYGNNTLVADSTPRVATVLDQIREVFKLVRHYSTKKPGSRTLSRLHVHTLAYQAIVVDMNSPLWKNSGVAAAKASLTAFRHVCASAQVSPDQAILLMDDSFSTSVAHSSNSQRMELVPENPIACWSEGSLEICIAPGIVCTSPSVTAGGGDNISAAALAMQL